MNLPESIESKFKTNAKVHLCKIRLSINILNILFMNEKFE